jgi:protein CWC15
VPIARSLSAAALTTASLQLIRCAARLRCGVPRLPTAHCPLPAAPPDRGAGEDDGDDDEAELLRELEKIKAEREAERAKRKAEEEAAGKQSEEDAALSGNPLLAAGKAGGGAGGGTGGGFGVKRRWDDDVVFKNQAKDERKPRKRFINDTIRSDFHRNFLAKYIK